MTDELLKIKSLPYYYDIDQFESEKLLNNKRNGTFLLRPSSINIYNQFAPLSVVLTISFTYKFDQTARTIWHYRILKDNVSEMYGTDDDFGFCDFYSIMNIIERYSNTDINCPFVYIPRCYFPLNKLCTLQDLCINVIHFNDVVKNDIKYSVLNKVYNF